MDPTALRYVLVVDWAKVENTPVTEHRPAILQRWHLRAQRLAELEGRPLGDVTREIKNHAHAMAARDRKHQLTELARDLAMSRALGKPTGPPWRRRLQRLVQVMNEPLQVVQQQVEQQASNVEVVVMS